MQNKRGAAVFLLFLILIVLVVFLLYLVNHFYFSEEPVIEDEKHVVSTKDSSIVRNTNTTRQPGPCDNLVDTFIKPDFDRFKLVLINYNLVKDVPKKGKISLKFYHFVGSCRIWDKNYFLSNGEIEEKTGTADIDLWIHSKYVDKITQTNLCDIIKEARQNGDLAQSTSISDSQLFWTYKGMIKYKDCLGL